MGLQEQLSLIDEPQRWTKICKAVLQAEYGSDYQPVDDSRADGGNDGYIRSEKWMFARHCFEKLPKRGLDANILTKLTSDLDKAIKLRDNGKYPIEKWSFLANYPVSEAVVSKANELGQKNDINVTILGTEYISGLLLKHNHVMKQFPELEQLEISAEVKKLAEQFAEQKSEGAEAKEKPIATTPKEKSVPSVTFPYDPKNKDLVEVQKLTSKKPDHAAKTRLAAISMSSSNRDAQIQAVLAIANWFDPLEDSAEDFIDLCDTAIAASKEAGRPREEALLLGIQGRFIGEVQGLKQIDLWQKLRINEVFGNIGNPDLLQEINKDKDEVVELDKQRRETLYAAMDAAEKTKDWYTYGYVLMQAGMSAGSLAGLLNKTGDIKSARALFKLSKKSLVEAKNCFERTGDRVSRAYALHNLANQLRMFDDQKELALEITNDVISEAVKIKDKRLEEAAKTLKKHIVTGKIPDYVNGEKD